MAMLMVMPTLRVIARLMVKVVLMVVMVGIKLTIKQQAQDGSVARVTGSFKNAELYKGTNPVPWKLKFLATIESQTCEPTSSSCLTRPQVKIASLLSPVGPWMPSRSSRAGKRAIFASATWRRRDFG